MPDSNSIDDAECSADSQGSKPTRKLDALWSSYVESLDDEKTQRLEQELTTRVEGEVSSTSGPWESFLSSVAATDGVTQLTKIGPFEIEGVLGRGGQGIVYLACDTREERRKVALKVLHAHGVSSHVLMERFEREAVVAAKLDHPGICGVLDSGVVDGVPYIAMPLIEGQPLSRWVGSEAEAEDSEPKGELKTEAETAVDGPRTRSDVMRAVKLMEDCSRATHVAHEAGVVHRDLKPSNIMVQPNGKPVIMDFGLARSESTELPTLTLTGELFGTPAYMAPEQLTLKLSSMDRRVDVWALGVILYEILSGQRPFQAATREGLYHSILNEDPPPLARLNAKLGRDLLTVVQTALAKDRDRRYQSALDLADDLQRVREQRSIRARSPGLPRRLQSLVVRNPGVAASVLCVIVILGAALAHSLTQKRDLETALSRYRQMSDDVLVRDLVARAESLWPRRPQKVAAMSEWLKLARGLTSRLPNHRKELARLKQQGVRLKGLGQQEPQFVITSGGLGFEDPEAGWRHKVLSGLVKDLEAMLDLVRNVESRHALSLDLEHTSIDLQREAWTQCIEDLSLSPRLSQALKEPVMGYTPLGKNRDSGLWEFWLVESGPRPRWKGKFLSGHSELSEHSGMIFVLLPGGKTTVGAQGKHRNLAPFCQGWKGETLQVDLAPFLISKYEMTQWQWRHLTGINPSGMAPGSPGIHSLRHPVEWISAETAERTLAWMDLLLPTEFQWEYAARGGTPHACWYTGEAEDSLYNPVVMANLKGGDVDGFEGHAPVGTYPPNPFGLHDILGNVWEWCRDRREGNAYLWEGEPRVGDGLMSGTGAFRRARGGGYPDAPAKARMFMGYDMPPNTEPPYVGLRPVYQLPGTRR